MSEKNIKYRILIWFGFMAYQQLATLFLFLLLSHATQENINTKISHQVRIIVPVLLARATFKIFNVTYHVRILNLKFCGKHTFFEFYFSHFLLKSYSVVIVTFLRANLS